MKMDRITPILTMSVSNVRLMFRGSIGVRLRVVNTNSPSVSRRRMPSDGYRKEGVQSVLAYCCEGNRRFGDAPFFEPMSAGAVNRRG
jgi:hypothetical protein